MLTAGSCLGMQCLAMKSHRHAKLSGSSHNNGAPLQWLGLPVGKLVPVPELAHAWPHLLIGRPQQLEHMQQLLQFTVAGEQGLLQQDECEQAKDSCRGLHALRNALLKRAVIHNLQEQHISMLSQKTGL